MSPATRVVTGTDDRGRPRAEWDATETVAPAYGHMQPAIAGTIERRRATPEELADARAREAQPDHLTTDNVRSAPFGATTSPPTPATVARMQASRLVGAQRHVEAVAASKSPTATQREWNGHAAAVREPQAEEEPAVTEIPADPHADIPEVIPDARPGGLHELAVAAEQARGAHNAYESARVAWDVARGALARAYAEVEGLIEPPPATPDDRWAGSGRPVQILETLYVPPATVDEVVARHATGPNRRGPAGRHAGSATEKAEKAERADRVIDALARHHDDVSAAAAELGMRPNAVAMVAKHARARQAAQA